MAVLLAFGVGCSPAQELPSVRDEGRYVRYAADMEDVYCAGTVGAIDTFVDQLFEELGESPPPSPFITYYWLPDGSDLDLCARGTTTTPNCVDIRGSESIVYSHNVFNRHEVVHAVHYAALGPSKSFLHEGLAQLYGDQLVDPSDWPEGLAIDEVLTGSGIAAHYAASWRIVYSIVQRHGVERLKEYWRRAATLENDDAPGLRAAFIDVFAEDIETMLAATETLTTCTIPLCGGLPSTAGAPWEIEAPASCDDTQAVGGWRAIEPIVTKDSVFEFSQPGDFPFEFNGNDSDDEVALRRCDNTCSVAADSIRLQPGSASPLSLTAGAWRVTIANRSGTEPSRFVLHSPAP